MSDYLPEALWPELESQPVGDDARDPLIQALEELAAVNRRLLAAIEALNVSLPRSASSVEVKTSTRGADIAVKAYEGSPIDDIAAQATAKYIEIVASMNQRILEAMRDTTS